jgi:hypothetical protein
MKTPWDDSRNNKLDCKRGEIQGEPCGKVRMYPKSKGKILESVW